MIEYLFECSLCDSFAHYFAGDFMCSREEARLAGWDIHVAEAQHICPSCCYLFLLDDIEELKALANTFQKKG